MAAVSRSPKHKRLGEASQAEAELGPDASAEAAYNAAARVPFAAHLAAHSSAPAATHTPPPLTPSSTFMREAQSLPTAPIRHLPLIGWSGQRMRNAAEHALLESPSPPPAAVSTLSRCGALPSSHALGACAWVRQDAEVGDTSNASERPRIPPTLHPSFRKIAMDAASANQHGAVVADRVPVWHMNRSQERLPYACLAAQLAPNTPQRVDWHPLHAIRALSGSFSMPLRQPGHNASTRPAPY